MRSKGAFQFGGKLWKDLAQYAMDLAITALFEPKMSTVSRFIAESGILVKSHPPTEIRQRSNISYVKKTVSGIIRT